ncbi:MAG: hypothetical protein HRT92_01995 [Piscirickettsiaceae bacterium]|nr:hypothetical protein [Piscirickettsiaceae bacterium]
MKPMEGTSIKSSVVTVASSTQKREKTIVVLGVERGGTSMVAGMIRALGVDLGERAGRNHEDPKFLTDDKDKLLQQIEANNAEKSVWGFKVPKASLMLDFYDKHLINPYYILVFRNVEATVDSWCSRGGNDPMQSALHAMNYYNTALEFLKGKKRPLIFASYERACDNPMAFAKDLANFIGIDADERLLNKAASIVTGEGGGYLDLPEYYFHLDALDCDAWPRLPLSFKLADDSQKHYKVSEKKVGDRVILCPEGEFFPKEFYIGFDLSPKGDDLLIEQGLRVYMDFTGEFFPGHAFRPPLKKGKNLLKLSNNGNVRRIALGPLRPGYIFGYDNVECFKVEGEDSKSYFQVIQPKISSSLPLMKRVANKLKKMIRK